MISEKTRQKIHQIATTCIRCRRCMGECIMLNRFTQNPKVLFTQYIEQGPENMDRHIAYSCNECSQCTLKCPKGLNLKEVFQSLKEDYAEENRGIVPVAALLPSEENQEKECASEYCTVLTAGASHKSQGKARYLFVPGQFSPEPILKHLRSALGENNVDMLSTRVLNQVSPQILSEIENSPSQVLITACPSSYQSLRAAVPERKVLYYWDLMHDLIGIPQEQSPEDTSVSLHDGVGDSVRWVLGRLGCQWREENEPSDDLAADRDCRQVLGLLFGMQEENKT